MIVGSACPVAVRRSRRAGSAFKRTCSAPGPWQASQAMPSSATVVWKAPVAAFRPGSGATLWQKTQLSFQRVTWRSNTPPP